MKISLTFRTAGLVLSLAVVAACPVAIVLLSDYVVSHYPPPHYPPLPSNPDNNAGASKILNYILGVQPIAAVVAVVCAHGWKWRVALTILGLVSLFISFVLGFGAGMNITGQEP